MYILSIKIHFKATHHLQNRENWHFQLPRLYTGHRFEQTMSECIIIFQRVKYLG